MDRDETLIIVIPFLIIIAFSTKGISLYLAKVMMNNVAEDVKKGLLLSDALERHPGTFSNLYISLVRAGEVSGKLSENGFM